MVEINYKPIFDYIDQTKKELKEELASKADLKRLQDTVDGIAKNFKNNDEKVIIVEAKSERIEHWVIDASKKINLPYHV